MDLVVGCPVAHRAWVLPHWFDHVEAACAHAGLAPRYVFVADPADESVPVLRARAPDAVLVPAANTKGDDRRVWNQWRYATMVELRNRLLTAVRGEGDLFLSLDSDILLAEGHLASMVGLLDRFGAVGAKCYMTATGTRFPSWARLGRDGQIQRMDATGAFPVDVIMAAKLMGPAALAVDYEHHLQGEDVGWSLACRRAGVRLGWDGMLVSKHVMAPHLLHDVDIRVGF